MLDLRGDLYAHLVISAHKNKPSNKQLKLKNELLVVDNSRNIALSVNPSKNIHDIPQHQEIVSGIDEKISHIPLSYPIKKIPVKSLRVEKIEEKVNNMIENPAVAEVKKDLLDIEILLAKIKSSDKHNPKIPLMEKSISRLKNLLEQKSYV